MVGRHPLVQHCTQAEPYRRWISEFKINTHFSSSIQDLSQGQDIVTCRAEGITSLIEKILIGGQTLCKYTM